MSKPKTTEPKTCGIQLHHGLHTMVCEQPKGHDGAHQGEGFTWASS